MHACVMTGEVYECASGESSWVSAGPKGWIIWSDIDIRWEVSRLVLVLPRLSCAKQAGADRRVDSPAKAIGSLEPPAVHMVMAWPTAWPSGASSKKFATSRR